MDTLVGSTLGGYTLTGVLGSGGMGAVYLAEDKAIGQQVAIKVVRTDDDTVDYEYTDPESKDAAGVRFRQEARAIASLDHLHILPLYRYGEERFRDGTRAYIVMQYRPEGSLWDWLRKRAGRNLEEDASSVFNHMTPRQLSSRATSWPLPLAEATDYLQQASSALYYAHQHGIVHRDVKPANFLLRFDQPHAHEEERAFLLLSDFGLAKFFISSSSRSNILGTPLYMAPEQFDGVASPASDQYALAVMIYYLLAGRPPFIGDPIRLMHQHLNVAPTPIRQFVPAIPTGLEPVLARAMAKQPGERYPTIMAFAEDFMLQVTNQPGGGQPSFPPVAPLQEQSIPSLQLPQQNELNSLTPFEAPPYPYRPFDTSLSPLTGHSEPLQQEHRMQPAQFLSTKTPPAAESSFANTAYAPTPSTNMPAHPSAAHGDVATSPTQEEHSSTATKGVFASLLTRRTTLWTIGGIVLLGLGGGVGAEAYLNGRNTDKKATPSSPSPVKYQLVGHQNIVTSLAWSPDGTVLASASLDKSVRIWDPHTKQAKIIYTGHSQGVETVGWSTDGRLLASGGRDQIVKVWDTTGATKFFSTAQGKPVSALVWNTDGQSIFFGTRGNGLSSIVLNKNSITPLRPKAFVTALSLAPDGNHFAMGTESGNIVIFNLPAAKAISTYHIHSEGIQALAWSPDSTLIASAGKDKLVQLYDVATKTVSRRLKLNSIANGLAWDPQGTGRLAIALAEGMLSLWKVDSTAQTRYSGHVGAVSSVAWSLQALATGSADKTIIVWNIQ